MKPEHFALPLVTYSGALVISIWAPDFDTNIGYIFYSYDLTGRYLRHNAK